MPENHSRSAPWEKVRRSRENCFYRAGAPAGLWAGAALRWRVIQTMPIMPTAKSVAKRPRKYSMDAEEMRAALPDIVIRVHLWLNELAKTPVLQD